MRKTKLSEKDINNFNQQYPTLKVKYTGAFHDRFLIIDDTYAYHIGAAIKDAGKKCFGISLIEDVKIVKDILERLKLEAEEVHNKVYEYDEKIVCIPERGGAYVKFPWNVREEFGKGRVKVHAEFDGEPYDGSVVNMGIKNEDGSVCYIIGITKAIRNAIKKSDGDVVHVKIQQRE